MCLDSLLVKFSVKIKNILVTIKMLLLVSDSLILLPLLFKSCVLLCGKKLIT